MNKLKSLFALLLLCSFASPAWSAPTIVQIGFTDFLGVSTTFLQAQKLILEDAYPNHKIISIWLKTSNPWGSDPYIGPREVARQLKAQLAADDTVTHLSIATHGNNQPDGENGSTFSYLGGIGNYGEGRINSQMKMAFEPLLGKMDPNAFLIMDACSTLDGEVEEAQTRVRELVRYLEIPHATVFGHQSVAYAKPAVFLRYKQKLNKIFPLVLRNLQLDGLLFGALAGGGLYFGVDASAVASATGLLAAYFTVYGLKLFSIINGSANRGLLMKFKNGEILSSRSISEFQEIHSIYRILSKEECEANVTPLAVDR